MSHYITKECIDCGVCLEACPTDSIIKGEKTHIIDADTCTDCTACVPLCPTDAIKKLTALVTKP
ncbi:MAG: 4Fe-4S binding protein [Deltaproteobacteria bacterium]|nr:4Fe-4S binding protein [Deltaproteobacteria bacterium]